MSSTVKARITDCEDDGQSIRSISRAIGILKAINRLDAPKLSAIANACDIPYPTAYRIVQTLLQEGVIERDDADRRYRPSEAALSLSRGVRLEDVLIRGARPHLAGLTKTVTWPVSLSIRMGTSMVIRSSTHAQTSMTFNEYHSGYALPILGSASGLVYLASAGDEERHMILDNLRMTSTEFDVETFRHVGAGHILSKVREDGYAVVSRNPHTLTPGKTSSIAVPVYRDGTLFGALALIFFSAAMRPTQAAQTYLDQLRATASSIEQEWGKVAQSLQS